MGNIYVQETYLATVKGVTSISGEGNIYESFTSDKGKLFKSYQKEFGGCTGKIYRESDNKAIGWVFSKKVKFEDVDGYYPQEVWVSLYQDVTGTPYFIGDEK